jgi:hypothetical protein
MAFVLRLPAPLPSLGWKVKIRDRERLEPPHVTIFLRRHEWRLGLRCGTFIVPPGGSWNEIDSRVRKTVEANWQLLCDEWDRAYPTNRVSEADGYGNA